MDWLYDVRCHSNLWYLLTWAATFASGVWIGRPSKKKRELPTEV